MLQLTDKENITMNDFSHEPLVHKLEEQKSMSPTKKTIALVLIIATGVISGYLLSANATNPQTSSSTGAGVEKSTSKVVVGSQDTKTFSDSAEGELEAGGINGEGTHRLIRPGGEQQTVYLTSSILDLNQFVNKKVRVWGETFAAKKAGWLMDVGKIEVLE